VEALQLSKQTPAILARIEGAGARGEEAGELSSDEIAELEALARLQ